MEFERISKKTSGEGGAQGAAIDRDLSKLFAEAVPILGAYLSENQFVGEVRGLPEGQEELESLFADLQDPKLLTNNSVPLELRVAIAHVDSTSLATTLGHLREVLVRASEFSGVVYTGPEQGGGE